MFQILHKIEILSFSFSNEAMLIIGAVLTLAGLFVWLGGLWWHYLTAFLSGVFIGVVSAGFTSEPYQLKSFGIAAVISALLVAVFRKRSLVFVAALIVIVSGLFLSSLPALNASTDLQLPTFAEKTDETANFTPEETFSILADILFYLAGIAGDHIKEVSASPILISSLAGFAILVGGILLARLFSAIGSAMLGTIFVFAGMIVLFLQKGSMPFTGIYQKPVLFQTIIICMVIFGSVCGFLLCPARGHGHDREKKMMEKKNDVI